AAMNVVHTTKVEPSDLVTFLGAPRYTRDRYQGNGDAGVVIGLGTLQVEIIFTEYTPRQTDDGLYILHLYGVVGRLRM
ncbi:hypothetical protein CLI75_12380, partial [Porphyromonas gingivalis]|uniref:hypothetical protein n=1 Tax=Porphyromonas gingivalis TaxID=837 RepID=UPI000BE6F5F5